MNKLQEALKAAIEALDGDTGYDNRVAARNLCKSALSEIGECEPVAWAILAKNGRVRIWWSNKESAMNRINANDGQYDTLEEGEQFVELYTSPISKEWVEFN